MAIDEDQSVAPVVGKDDPRRFTDSGIEVEPVYTADGPARPTFDTRRARASSRSRAG